MLITQKSSYIYSWNRNYCTEMHLFYFFLLILIDLWFINCITWLNAVLFFLGTCHARVEWYKQTIYYFFNCFKNFCIRLITIINSNSFIYDLWILYVIGFLIKFSTFHITWTCLQIIPASLPTIKIFPLLILFSYNFKIIILRFFFNFFGSCDLRSSLFQFSYVWKHESRLFHIWKFDLLVW